MVHTKACNVAQRSPLEDIQIIILDYQSRRYRIIYQNVYTSLCLWCLMSSVLMSDAQMPDTG
jgi:hypothetical protein